jgi:ABC-type antimicrobial peptide transport system permease subunit
LSGLALLLAVLGVSALLLYRHERQRRAVGIRICLGATRTRVVGSALADSGALAMAGSIVGATVVLAMRNVPEAGRLLPSEGTTPALLIAATVVATLAMLGGLLPAWRAGHLQPSQVLKEDG